MWKHDEYGPKASALPWPIRVGAPCALTLALLTGCVSGNSDDQPGGAAGDGNAASEQQKSGKGQGDGKSIYSTTATYLPEAAQLDIMSLERVSAETVVLRFRITNNSAKRLVMLYNMSDDGDREADKTVSGVSLIDPDGQKQYFPWFTENRTCYCSEWDNHNFPPGETWDFWAAYPAPPKGVDKLSISTRIAAPINDIPITDGTAPEEPSGDLTDPKILDIRKLEEDLDSGTSRDESGDDVSVMLSSDVLFDLNESKLTGKADSILKKVAKEIDDSSATTVKIDGYTDSSGNDAINEPLSEDRAKSVEKKIKELTSRSGITYEVAGHGSADPVADNNTEEGAQKNRRVTVTFAK